MIFHDFHIGTVLPVLHHIRVVSYTAGAPLAVQAELTYTGDAHASLQTCLCLNVPVAGLATLPVDLALSNLCVNVKAAACCMLRAATPLQHRNIALRIQ